MSTVPDVLTPARESATGQWFTARDGRPWWFDSGSLALDFAYTGALGDDSSWERLGEPADLADWLGERFADTDALVHDRHLRDALMLRESIARLTRAAPAVTGFTPTDIDAVNLFAATPDVPPALPGGSRRAGRSTTSTNQALSSIARDAVTVFSAENVARVRRCAADDCGLIYVDTSRAGSRRWCSMQRCGNRAKVRRFRAAAAASAD